jgi:flagellar motor protein MotB
MMNLIDSHDTYRFLESAKGDVSKLKLAAFFQMTWVGTPNIWYGDEIGMMGAKDPDCRRPFNWRYTEDKKNVDLHDYYKKLISIRKKHPALRTGTITPLVTDGMVYGFLRNLDRENMVVILNNDAQDISTDVKIDLPDGPWLDELSGKIHPLKDGKITIPLNAMSGVILVQATDVKNILEKTQNDASPKMKDSKVSPKEVVKPALIKPKELSKQQAKVQTDSEMQISNEGNVYFDSGSTQLNTEAIKILTVFISKCNDADLPFKIKLIGHTDNQKIVGDLAKKYPTNWDLSVSRCMAVANYLINTGKIDSKSISFTGMADSEPANVKKYNQQDMNDRRVELLIME